MSVLPYIKDSYSIAVNGDTPNNIPYRITHNLTGEIILSGEIKDIGVYDSYFCLCI